MDSWAAPLGSGAVGIVYLGYHYHSGAPVAIKMMKPEYSEIPVVRERAKKEAQLTFLHPNIVRMLGLCEYENGHGPIYVLSEFVNGLNIDSYCRAFLDSLDYQNRLLTILRYSASILDALEYVHRAGVIHRDVKPSNIMVSYDHIPKLMDLGIAGFAFSEQHSNDFIGTALYAAPEQIRGESVDGRADIYAMGVTMFELLTGYNPFSDDTQESILDRHLSEDLPSDSMIPDKLMTVLRKATDRKAARRYRSAIDFAGRIKGIINEYVSDSVKNPSGWVFGHKDRW